MPRSRRDRELDRKDPEMPVDMFRLATAPAETKKQRMNVAYRLLEERKVFLGREVRPSSANRLIAQLMFLEAENPEAPIELYINSPGGEVSSGLAIYDLIRMVKPEVKTISAGLTASIATIILVGGSKGKRLSWPNSRILIHQPLGGIRGQATDVEIHAREILKIKDKVNQILADHTGQPVKKIEKDTNRDYWMSANEAKEYGIVDQILPYVRDTASA
jgi:ATP-dependent Clp protease, protease subunit